MSVFQTLAVYAAINLVLLVWLSLGVVIQRRRAKTALGDGGVPPLALAIRVHANASEYIPITLTGLAILVTLSPPLWLVHAIGGSFTLGRIAHAMGLSLNNLALRSVGMALTWTPMLALAAALIWRALG